MQLINYFKRFKKHQLYLYISVLLVAIFFIGNSLITPKITSVTINLIEDMIQGDLKSKVNIVAFEFNQLNEYIVDSENILRNSSEIPFTSLKRKLYFTLDLAKENEIITNSFVSFVSSKNKEEIHWSNVNDSLYKSEINTTIENIKDLNREVLIDTIIKTNTHVINRKVYAKKSPNNVTTIIGYDVDLLAFWKYFSERYKGAGGYTVVTNKDGICLLHPETKYIGSKLNGYFESISIESVLQSSNKINQYYLSSSSDALKDKATSEFLGLEVRRYFDTIKTGSIPLIVIVSFPIDINLRETIQHIQRYFSWISFLAFSTFILILIVSRLQLKKEYAENIKVVEEKEQLINVNEIYQKENALLQLNQLKKKMNPHFLFNSLNSLHVLIELNPDLSQQFVLKLADVYRYHLEDRDDNLITVKKEITFLEQYIFLQEIRFNNSLNVSIFNNCDEKILLKKIPFLSLETLVENAIKHNEITKQSPLIIEVIINKENITVQNNFMPRKIEDNNSHFIGLNYLKNTYKYYQINTFKTEVIDGKFKCILPLLP